MHGQIPHDFFLRIDPLVAASAMLAARAVIKIGLVSLVVVVITILMGRVFCGWFCPMGTILDVSDRLFHRSRPRQTKWRFPHLKYAILAGVLVSSLFTMQGAYLFDPISLLTRSIVISVFSPLQMGIQALLGQLYAWSSSSFGPLASSSLFLSDRISTWQIAGSAQVYYRESFLILAIFLGIVALNSLSKRFWCRNICPLGALLGLLSRIPIIKRTVNSECVECGKCTRDCKMGAILENPRLARLSECVECYDCVPACPKKAQSFRLIAKSKGKEERQVDLSRRRLLQGAGIGLAFAAMAKIDPGRKHPQQAPGIQLSSESLIRPPGALPEDEFVNRCVRCGTCMKACPTGGLQPAIYEGGIEGFWTPVLVPKIGCCTQECNACGQVCPTAAIRPFKFEEKKGISIGRAMVDKSRCLAWSGGRKCLVCREYCSYHAIEAQAAHGVGCPVVDNDKCVGCGACENACPIQPVAAIRVTSMGDRRGGRSEQRYEG